MHLAVLQRKGDLMLNEPLVSIIVPVYRTESYLRRCIDSILAQTYPNWELILVDDGSPDLCPAICDTYAATNTRVHVLHQENKGVSAARNAGLDIAHGEYIAFADSDDWVEPDYLSYLLELLEKNGTPLVACNHFVTVNNKDVAKFPVKHEAQCLTLKTAYDKLLYHRPPDASAWGKLYTRSLFVGLRYPAGHIFEDTWIIADLLERAGGLTYGGEPKYHYVYRENTLSKCAADNHVWDFMDAVDHLSDVIIRSYPELSSGCTRRRVHAALSIRRLLVHSDASARGDIARCRAIVCAGAKEVFCDRRAPIRDKAGILLSLAGRNLFDIAWSLYSNVRRRY